MKWAVPSSEWYALCLAIIDEESIFGQTSGDSVYSPTGGYPGGRWLGASEGSNARTGGGIGPFQVTGSDNFSRYGGESALLDTETNVHAGVHELWCWGNLPHAFPNSGSGSGEPFGVKYSVEWMIRAYNGGQGGAMNRSGATSQYVNRVWDERYPWYLQQLQASGMSAGSGNAAGLSTTGGSVTDKGQALINANMASPYTANEDCVNTARFSLTQAFTSDIALALEPRVDGKHPGVEIGAGSKGRYLHNSHNLPSGWFEVTPGSPNGLAFREDKNHGGSGTWGHTYIIVAGKRYDQTSTKAQAGQQMETPNYQFCCAEWSGSTAGSASAAVSTSNLQMNNITNSQPSDHPSIERPLTG
jgi:hypothetical protein